MSVPPGGEPMDTVAEYVDDLPSLCGQEPLIREAVASGRQRPAFPGPVDLGGAASAFAVALHMHQPLIPAAGDDLRSAGIISNLAWMMEHPHIGDSHNAPAFAWCYRRMGEFIPQLLGEGRQPRVMLDYSGTLLHGMRQMGLDDVFDALGYLTRDPRARQAVEWLGCTWGHVVAPSTPRRTSGCTCAPGSTISLPSSALRRSGASGDPPPPRWRCPTTLMSPARSSAPWLTAAINGCWSRSTPWSSPTAAASSTRICRTGWCAQTRAAPPPASSR